MNDASRGQVMDLLVKASELPTEQRETFIELACGDDATLRAEVTSLLKHHSSKTITPAGQRRSAPTTVFQKVGSALARPQVMHDVGATRRWFWAVVVTLVFLSALAWWIRG